MRKNKKVVMSKKEITLIILTVVGAISLMAWQTYRMAQHHIGAASVGQNVPVKTSQTQ